ncbi:MAG: phosphonopyruvate decarboxylase [Myxococcales bacterium]|nr:phosphonopyruvate decarboxylase [Myxococcales bacterium]
MLIDDFGQILKDHGVRSGSGVPCSFFTPLVNYMDTDPGLDYLGAASEGEAVAIAAGLCTGGRPAFALMQNSGLGNAVNPITSMLYIYQIPVALLVSHRGEPGRGDEPQHRLMGQITEELVRLCGVECHVLQPTSFADELASALGRGVPAGWVCRKETLEKGPKARPVTLAVTTSAFELPPRRSLQPSVRREEALASLLPLFNRGVDQPAVIGTTGKLSRELYELDDREHTRNNRFYMVGSMGCASGFGLGVARARSRRKVVVLDGDGAMLMKMGTLATIGAVKPTNLHHIVIDNGAHESTGAQPTVSPGVDFAAIALACGYRQAATVADLGEFRATFERQFESEGPTLLRMLVNVGSRGDLGRPSLEPRDGWLRFKQFLESE